MNNRKIWIALLTSLALLTSPYVAAEHEDRDQDNPGFFSRIWESTKDILGIDRDRDRDEDEYDDDDDDDDEYKDRDKDGHKTKSKDRDHDRDEAADARRRVFTDEEKRILRDYYRDEHYDEHPKNKQQKALPPGLKKKVARGGELPPGWQKKMARGEVLPEDVYRYGHRLPDDVWRRLPRQPDGTNIIFVEDKVARVIEATRTIVDVLDL